MACIALITYYVYGTYIHATYTVQSYLIIDMGPIAASAQAAVLLSLSGDVSGLVTL